jgi:hypothetical protein
MKAKLIHGRGEKTFALVFDLEDEVIASLTGFANVESRSTPRCSVDIEESPSTVGSEYVAKTSCRDDRGKEARVVRVVEHVAGHYDVQEVEFGRVYKWRPERVMIECDCGESTTLTAYITTCGDCSMDHASLIREELAARRLEEDVASHPWRSWRSSRDTGIPF